MSYFLFVPLRSFFLCYPGEALEGPISTGVSNKPNNIDSNDGIPISRKYYTIYMYIYSIVFFLGYLYAVIRINVVKCSLLTPVEIGPSNASPG